MPRSESEMMKETFPKDPNIHIHRGHNTLKKSLLIIFLGAIALPIYAGNWVAPSTSSDNEAPVENIRVPANDVYAPNTVGLQAMDNTRSSANSNLGDGTMPAPTGRASTVAPAVPQTQQAANTPTTAAPTPTQNNQASQTAPNQVINNYSSDIANNPPSEVPTYAGVSTNESPYELYGLLMCSQPGFKCIPVRPGETWYTLFPNDTQRNIVMRINRTNVALQYRKWLIVPKDWKNLSYENLSPFPQHINSVGGKLLIINLKKYAFAAYDASGNRVYWGPAAGGEDLCSDEQGSSCNSAAGSFKIFKIEGPDCISHKYPIETHGGAPMPWCMFYHDGFAIHGSTLSGFVDRSRGCIRLFYEDASWLYSNFAQIGTRVIVER